MKIIKNERQYEVTRQWICRFTESLQELERSRDNRTDIDPLLIRAKKGGLRMWLKRLNRQVEDYESVKAGQAPEWDWEALERLPEILVLTRMALRMTEEELAERMGVTEQDIRNFKENDYGPATLSQIKLASMVLLNACRRAGVKSAEPARP